MRDLSLRHFDCQCGLFSIGYVCNYCRKTEAVHELEQLGYEVMLDPVGGEALESCDDFAEKFADLAKRVEKKRY